MKVDLIKLHVAIGFTIIIGLAILYGAKLMGEATTISGIFFYFMIVWLMIKELFRSIDDAVSSIDFKKKARKKK